MVLNLCCLIFPFVNLDKTAKITEIEFTLLLHCKLDNNKNARVVVFTGVFKSFF